ncbi:alpha-L-fucosidase [Anaerobacterium chartisolvens]|uniref:alpha-L-fucosidase n=1 Tax=Anaerobacterium chartisolvens TaxID=1297424 RepID=A0A369B889_9FIRM|nr:alpha-L-fucosidase [Anaerobacterium chartisolvens]RCX17525.1 alpha-L-fucosidase [Anaerobacterium chartisolvens]
MINAGKNMDWWRKARFGMFIHWGLYSLAGGWWEGREVPFPSEWIMKNGKIPLKDYKKQAGLFNPIKFDAREWVKIAKQTGMKYIVVTAKHHDGFAMYHTKVSPYNIADATPFGRDPIRELAEACRAEGVVFCIYYSQMQDWEHPDGAGNTWDFPDEDKKDFGRYIEERVKPQLHELLTNYGPVGIMWFDTPYEMPKKYCEEIADFVRGIQPQCLINSRIGYGLGDYRSMGDNSIPVASYPHDWETPMTLNDSWGFKEGDDNWKLPETLLRMLVDINGNGGNFLLNVGPDALGVIPDRCVKILKTLGDWLKVNGESIYETTPAPDFPYVLNWGGFTARENRLYMHVFQWPESPYEILVYTFKTKVKNAYFLSDKSKTPIKVLQTYESGRDEYRMRVLLPEKPIDSLDTVIVLELEGKPEIYHN